MEKERIAQLQLPEPADGDPHPRLISDGCGIHAGYKEICPVGLFVSKAMSELRRCGCGIVGFDTGLSAMEWAGKINAIRELVTEAINTGVTLV